MRLGSVELLRNCSDGLVALPRCQPGFSPGGGTATNPIVLSRRTKRNDESLATLRGSKTKVNIIKLCQQAARAYTWRLAMGQRALGKGGYRGIQKSNMSSGPRAPLNATHT